MYRITGSCTIRDGVVRKDGAAIFEDRNAPDAAAFLLSVYGHCGFNYPRFYKMDNLSKLGWLGSEVMLAERVMPYRPEEVGVLLTNANASLDTDLKYFETLQDIPSPSLFGYTLPNIVIGEICIRNRFKGENGFFVNGVFDAGLIEQQVGLLMEQGGVKACVCGWVELVRADFAAALFLVEREGARGEAFKKEQLEKLFFE